MQNFAYFLAKFKINQNHNKNFMVFNLTFNKTRNKEKKIIFIFKKN